MSFNSLINPYNLGIWLRITAETSWYVGAIATTILSKHYSKVASMIYLSSRFKFLILMTYSFSLFFSIPKTTSKLMSTSDILRLWKRFRYGSIISRISFLYIYWGSKPATYLAGLFPKRRPSILDYWSCKVKKLKEF